MKEIKGEKVKPKFDKGDWIIHQGTENIYQVVAIIDNQYQLKYGDNYTVQKCDDVDRHARLCITKENKELLFVDLCARLPYHVRCKIWLKDGTTEEGFLDLEHNYADVLLDAFYYNKIKDIKPYLRPMSSITEEEFTELKNYTELKYDELELVEWDDTHKTIEFYLEEIPHYCVIKVFDWLNARHFDYRGLIDKGLALEAQEVMYNLK